MDGNEASLETIPTDQLVLTLLRELSRRVEKLEGQGQSRGGPVSNTTRVAIEFEQSKYESHTSEWLRKATPNELSSGDHSVDPKDSQNTGLGTTQTAILIPYGHLLDGETPYPVIPQKPVDRLAALTTTHPNVAARFRQLGGLVHVPADFRFQLTNFWDMDWKVQKVISEEALEFVQALSGSEGDFWITDYDRTGKVTHYEVGYEPGDGLGVGVVSVGENFERRAPWRRVILLQGISEISSQMRFDFLRRNGELNMTYRNPFFSAISPTDAINMHLGRSHGQAMHIGGGFRFHISWCRARRLPSNRTRSRQGMEELKVGQLYGSMEQFLCQEAYTIHAIPDTQGHASMTAELSANGPTHFQDHWTILLLTPLGFYSRGLFKVPRIVVDLSCSPLQINMVVLIEDALSSARRSWRGLHQYVDELLGTGTEIFDPELHDSLLSDDELFSGSRKYFWLINSLQTFDNILRQNVETWEAYRETFLMPLSKALEHVGGTHWKMELDDSVQICNRLAEDLTRVQMLFRGQRERTLALREGLFSASAVVESRASTRLGENVKLLTYVSIFYLPLAFCTSLWSTTDTFSFTTLSYVMVLVSLITYVLVFNLNSLVKSIQSRYLRFKIRVVESMILHPNHKWQETGIEFNRYKPRNTPKEKKPSEWWVLVFWVGGLFGIRRRATERSDGHGEDGESVSRRPSEVSAAIGSNRAPDASGLKWYSRFLRQGSGKESIDT